MRWPPNQAWTSAKSRKGYRHFEVIDYGGKGEERWVTLTAILDKSIQFKVNWTDLKTYSKWTLGWLQISDND